MQDRPSMPGQPTGHPWRRRLRISLRGLMILVLIVGGVLGWIIHRARVRREAVAAIRQAGGTVYYQWQWRDGSYDQAAQPAVPGWLLDRLGPDLFYGVKRVDLIGRRGADDVLMTRVGQLRDLEALSLNGCRRVTDAGLAHLSRLTGLRSLDLSFTGATGAGLKHLQSLTRLERLELPFGPTTDADLASLGGLTALRWLQLPRPRPEITDAGLAHLVGLINLETISLHSPRITSAGLSPLRD